MFWSASLLSPLADLGRFLNTSFQFVCMCQQGTGWEYDQVLTTYKPHSTLIFDANVVSRKLAECLLIKTCLNPPRGRGEKRIGTLASEDVKLMRFILSLRFYVFSLIIMMVFSSNCLRSSTFIFDSQILDTVSIHWSSRFCTNLEHHLSSLRIWAPFGRLQCQ